jgi:hypothetical protein
MNKEPGTNTPPSDAPAIDRQEWERRFVAHFGTRGITFDSPKVMENVTRAELDSWPEREKDWLDISPEAAADENLSYWEDDGE